MKWQDDSLLWENVHMFMQILIYNLIIVLNNAKMYFYYNFEEFFFILTLVLSLLPAGGLKMQLVLLKVALVL